MTEGWVEQEEEKKDTDEDQDKDEDEESIGFSTENVETPKKEHIFQQMLTKKQKPEQNMVLFIGNAETILNNNFF